MRTFKRTTGPLMATYQVRKHLQRVHFVNGANLSQAIFWHADPTFEAFNYLVIIYTKQQTCTTHTKADADFQCDT